MYPDLSYFFHDIFGTSVDNWTSIFKTFGFMLVMALIACGVMLKSELRRLEKQGLILPQTTKIEVTEKFKLQDILMNSIITMLLGAKIPVISQDFSVFSADPASILFSSKGNWLIGILAGLGVAIYYFVANAKKPEGTKIQTITYMPSEKTNDIVMLAGLSGVLGSKLFSITEDLSGFFKDPIGQLFSGSGLNVFGGLILAFIVVYTYVKKIGIKPIYMMDIGGMGILLGYAIGRIGCQLSGDGDWGIVAAAQPEWWMLPDWLWSYQYPNNVNNDGVLMAQCNVEAFNETLTKRMSIESRCLESCGMRYCHELNPKVYPTPIYETVISLIAFGLLWAFRRKFTIAGTMFFVYMVFNGIERFFIEKIRVNEKYEYFGVEWSQAQYISIGFIIVGIAGLIYIFNNRDKLKIEKE